jgi:DinB superfamily
VPEKRADTLLKMMQFIEWFTLQRAWDGLSDDELFWEPITGSWGVRRRGECQTATPFGDGGWVADFDADLVRAADEGTAIEPLTTIGWLMWHIGSVPGRLAQLDFLGGPKTAGTGWTSPYLTAHPVFTSAAGAVDSMRAGWRALERSLQAATDVELERPTRGYTYSDEPGPPAPGEKPGPLTYGAAIIASTLNEISHHGTQICVLRDLYRVTNGRVLTPEASL